jgi:hydroxyacylglutathione hydrolase
MVAAMSSAESPALVTVIPVTPFQQNCSIIVCRATRECAVVDPGGDLDEILAAIAELGAKPTKILVTHAHLDHAGGVAELAERLAVPIEGPQRADQFWIDRMEVQAQMFGFGQARTFVPTRWLEQGDRVSVGEVELEVRHCPGHTPGHVVFISKEAKLAFVGDVLFHGSIGRSDFPLGDLATLLRSIETELLTLPDEVSFVSGHGPVSTIGRERRNNPYLQRLPQS